MSMRKDKLWGKIDVKDKRKQGMERLAGQIRV